MIQFKVKNLLEKNKMSRYKLRQYTGFSYDRVNQFYFGKAKAIKTEELEILCKIFKYNIIDIVEYKEK